MIESTLLRASLALAAAASLCAQSHPQAEGSPTVEIGRGCGTFVDDGVPWGFGPDYKVRFGASAIEFVPALGDAAAANLPLRIELESVGRAGSGLRPVVGGERTITGDQIRYERGTLRETYELREDGVEQSFTFRELPNGAGDLVIRCRVDTALGEPVPRADRPGLSFVRDGVGGVTIGGVTGIDADGARAAGWIRCRDGVLELGLPAAFVDRARLPLVVDPLLGTAVTVSTGTAEEVPDIATLRPSGSNPTTFLVVWQRRFSNSDLDIRGQRIGVDASPIGGPITIRGGSLASLDPRVCPVAQRNRFVVTWSEFGGGNPSYIAACSVSATTGAVSNTIQVVAGTDSFTRPDVGGDLTGNDPDAIAVWANSTQQRIEASRLVVAADGTLSRLGRTILSGTTAATRPAIAETGGLDQRYLVAWETISRVYSSVIEGVVIDRLLGVHDTVAISPAGGEYEIDCDVDGDGDHWLVAYESIVAGSGGDVDVRAQWVTFHEPTDQAYLGGEDAIASDSAAQEWNPAVALTRNSVEVVFAEQRNGNVNDARLKSVEQYSCIECEGFFDLEASGAFDARNVAVAFDRFDNIAMAVWQSTNPTTGVSAVRARRFQPADGYMGAMENPCGQGGTTTASCAREGQARFRIRLEHAEPNRPLFLLYAFRGFGAVQLPCGTCAMLDPFEGLALPFGTSDAFGNHFVGLHLPSGASGATFSFQCVVLPSGTPGCSLLGVDLSTIGIVIVD